MFQTGLLIPIVFPHPSQTVNTCAEESTGGVIVSISNTIFENLLRLIAPLG